MEELPFYKINIVSFGCCSIGQNETLLCKRIRFDRCGHSIDAASFVDDFPDIGVKRLWIVGRWFGGNVAGWRRWVFGEIARKQLAVDFGTEFRVVEKFKASSHLLESVLCKCKQKSIKTYF